MRYKLLITYDGRDYCGWQRQPNGISIQSVLEEALTTLLRTPISITGAGRTDAGVHALGQVAHFDTHEELKPEKLLNNLKGMLPGSIKVKAWEKAAPNFHARYSAVGKEYHYHLWLNNTSDPFLAPFRYHPRFSVSIPLLQEAAAHFTGTHDFTTFTNCGSGAKTALRTIQRLDIILQEGGLRLEFEGNGFLYKMVRNIVGTLLEVASKKRTVASINDLFDAKDRRAAAAAAPAHALFLMKVSYSDLE